MPGQHPRQRTRNHGEDLRQATRAVRSRRPQAPAAIEAAALGSGGYPYKRRLKRKPYEEELGRLQIQLVKLQRHVTETGRRIVILFEGPRRRRQGRDDRPFREYINPASPLGRADQADRRRARPVVLPALRGAVPDRRRNRALRPLLVQPRRRRAGDGLLHPGRDRQFLRDVPGFREDPGRRRHQALQVLTLDSAARCSSSGSTSAATTR